MKAYRWENGQIYAGILLEAVVRYNRLLENRRARYIVSSRV
jgi:hypothetical protein